MTDNELNRALGEEGELVPSSGFAHAVMQRVLSEATAPPRLAFPWVRALPGLVVGVAALAMMLFAVWERRGIDAVRLGTGSSGWAMMLSGFGAMVRAGVDAGSMLGLGWIVLALALTFGSITVCLRLTESRTPR